MLIILALTNTPHLTKITNLYRLLGSVLSRHETLHSPFSDLRLLSSVLTRRFVLFPLPNPVFYSGISFKLASFTEVS